MVSIVYVCVSLTLLLLPAASVNVTLASIVLSASAVKSLPGTLTVHVPAVLSTVAVYVWPLTITVTTVFAASAGTFFNTPVTVTLPDASDALITLSAVTESTVKLTPSVFGPTASTIAVPGNDGLPAGSVAIASTSSPSLRPGFGTDQLPSGPATTVAVSPLG